MKTVWIAAGGTGGHLNAALAIGEYFKIQKWNVIYFSGMRDLDYKLLGSEKVFHFNAKPLKGKGILSVLNNLIFNFIVLMRVFSLCIKSKPKAVIGCGGYVCGPVCFAAKLCNKDIYILEQNALAGLTNRLLSLISKKIFTHFMNTKGLEKFKDKIVITGNPIRSKIQKCHHRDHFYPLRVLIFGGSLGAAQINDIVESYFNEIPSQPIEIIHQTGKTKNKIVNSNPNINYAQFEYIDDIQEKYNWCDVIVARSGASTVSELMIVGKPVLLIPFPFASDNHQWFNAQEIKNEAKFSVIVADSKISIQKGVTLLKNLVEDALAGKLISHYEDFERVRAQEIIFQEVSK